MRDGYVSLEQASEVYGVVIAGDPQGDPEGLEIDEVATQKRRTG